MSQVNIRRDRSRGPRGSVRPPSLGKLVAALVLVLLALWYLSQYT